MDGHLTCSRVDSQIQDTIHLLTTIARQYWCSVMQFLQCSYAYSKRAHSDYCNLGSPFSPLIFKYLFCTYAPKCMQTNASGGVFYREDFELQGVFVWRGLYESHMLPVTYANILVQDFWCRTYMSCFWNSSMEKSGILSSSWSCRYFSTKFVYKSRIFFLILESPSQVVVLVYHNNTVLNSP